MKIVLATEGSECSWGAVHEAATRPWPEGSRLLVLAVNAPFYPYPVPDPFLVLEGARHVWGKEERQRLESIVQEIAETIANSEEGGKLEIETEVTDGTPKDVIVERAEAFDADLILIGSHGFGTVKRFVLGSVSQAVASHAHCSVEIVRSKEKIAETAG